MTARWHGGVPGLGIGDLLAGGNTRRAHDGCPFCAARASGGAVAGPGGVGIDGPSKRPDRLYVTEDREYARFYASLYGRGDLYRVDAIGELLPSPEDHFPTFTVEAARVASVYSRAVLLTRSQRRALNVRWQHADLVAAAARS